MRIPVAVSIAIALSLSLAASAQDEDIEWEEEDAATPLLETLRGLDPGLPCIVAEAEVMPTFEANTVRVSLATQGCKGNVERDPGPEAPSALGVYVRVLEVAEQFVVDQGIENATAFKVQFAALGWTAEVDRAAWKDATGSAGERLTSAATWTSTPADLVVIAPPDLLGSGDDDDRKVLNAETIADVIRSNNSSLMYCQQSRIDSSAGTRPRGEARVSMTIDARGVVRGAEVVSSTFEDPAIDACLVERFSQMAFPESNTDEEFDITWPVKFD
jgi:hypothetical protein